MRSLPLAWKLMIPFALLILVVGSLGGFLIVRDLSSRAQTTLYASLLGRSLDARSFIRDRELYILESANLSANLEGMRQAVADGRADAVTELLRSVRALKTDLDLLVVTDDRGIGLAESVRSTGTKRSAARGTSWRAKSIVATVLRDGQKSAGLMRLGKRTLVTLAAPICAAATPCTPTGSVIVGLDAKGIAASAVEASGSPSQGDRGLAIHDLNGDPLASAGIAAIPPGAADLSSDRLIHRLARVGQQQVATLYAPLELQGSRAGTLAMTIPTAPAFSSVRGAAVRLAVILLVAMAGIVAIGSLLARYILRQLRPLVSTNRALGFGDLSARAPVLADDELGELARGVNLMAEALEASVSDLELRVSERTEEVQRLLRERTEFFASISHEFRTPLAVLLRHAEMLGDPTYTKSTRWNNEASKMVKGSGLQLLAMVNDILELAKIESGRIDIDLEPLRLADVVDEMRSTIKGLAKGSSLKVGIDVPRDLPVINGDRLRMRQVILNLVDNAVKYTPEGGRIDVDAAAVNGHVEVTVTDTGVGIPADVGDRIFDPFYRVEGTTTQRGQASSGLGLALARRLVEAQGGRLWFTSAPGEGSMFRFSLPRDPGGIEVRQLQDATPHEGRKNQ